MDVICFKEFQTNFEQLLLSVPLLYHHLVDFPSRDQMDILQDSARILKKLSISQDMSKRCYLARSDRKMVILQDLCQKNGYLARFLRVRSGRAVLLLAPIHATHFLLTRNVLKNQLRVI